MANLVGDKPLTQQKRDKLVAQLEDILERLSPHRIILDKASRRRTPAVSCRSKDCLA